MKEDQRGVSRWLLPVSSGASHHPRPRVHEGNGVNMGRKFLEYYWHIYFSIQRGSNPLNGEGKKNVAFQNVSCEKFEQKDEESSSF